MGVSGPQAGDSYITLIGGGFQLWQQPAGAYHRPWLAATIDEVEIIWPDGGMRDTVRNLPLDRAVEITEGQNGFRVLRRTGGGFCGDEHVESMNAYEIYTAKGDAGDLRAAIPAGSCRPAPNSKILVARSRIGTTGRRGWRLRRRFAIATIGLLVAGLLAAFGWSEFYPQALTEADKAYRHNDLEIDDPVLRKATLASRPFSRRAALSVALCS